MVVDREMETLLQDGHRVALTQQLVAASVGGVGVATYLEERRRSSAS